LRVDIPEDNAFPCEGVDAGGRVAWVPVGAQMIRPESIDENYEDIGPRRLRLRPSGGGSQQTHRHTEREKSGEGAEERANPSRGGPTANSFYSPRQRG